MIIKFINYLILILDLFLIKFITKILYIYFFDFIKLIFIF